MAGAQTPIQGLSFFSTEGGVRPPRAVGAAKPAVVARSNPVQDGERLIAKLRQRWPHVCNGIFAPWDLRWFYDEYDFHQLGGHFLYVNVISAMQKQNEAHLQDFCKHWSDCNQNSFHLFYTFKNLTVEQMFHPSDLERYGPGFLIHAQKFICAAFARAEVEANMPLTSVYQPLAPVFFPPPYNPRSRLGTSTGMQRRGSKPPRFSSEHYINQPWQVGRPNNMGSEAHKFPHQMDWPSQNRHNFSASPKQSSSFSGQLALPPEISKVYGPIPFPTAPTAVPDANGDMHYLPPLISPGPVAALGYPPVMTVSEQSPFANFSGTAPQHQGAQSTASSAMNTMPAAPEDSPTHGTSPSWKSSRGRLGRSNSSRKSSFSSNEPESETRVNENASHHSSKRRNRPSTSGWKAHQGRHLPAPAEHPEESRNEARPTTPLKKRWFTSPSSGLRDSNEAMHPVPTATSPEYEISSNKIGPAVNNVLELRAYLNGQPMEGLQNLLSSMEIPVVAFHFANKFEDTPHNGCIIVKFHSADLVREVLSRRSELGEFNMVVPNRFWTVLNASPSNRTMTTGRDISRDSGSASTSIEQIKPTVPKLLDTKPDATEAASGSPNVNKAEASDPVILKQDIAKSENSENGLNDSVVTKTDPVSPHATKPPVEHRDPVKASPAPSDRSKSEIAATALTKTDDLAKQLHASAGNAPPSDALGSGEYLTAQSATIPEPDHAKSTSGAAETHVKLPTATGYRPDPKETTDRITDNLEVAIPAPESGIQQPVTTPAPPKVKDADKGAARNPLPKEAPKALPASEDRDALDIKPGRGGRSGSKVETNKPGKQKGKRGQSSRHKSLHSVQGAMSSQNSASQDSLDTGVPSSTTAIASFDIPTKFFSRVNEEKTTRCGFGSAEKGDEEPPRPDRGINDDLDDTNDFATRANSLPSEATSTVSSNAVKSSDCRDASQTRSDSPSRSVSGQDRNRIQRDNFDEIARRHKLQSWKKDHQQLEAALGSLAESDQIQYRAEVDEVVKRLKAVDESAVMDDEKLMKADCTAAMRKRLKKKQSDRASVQQRALDSLALLKSKLEGHDEKVEREKSRVRKEALQVSSLEVKFDLLILRKRMVTKPRQQTRDRERRSRQENKGVRVLFLGNEAKDEHEQQQIFQCIEESEAKHNRITAEASDNGSGSSRNVSAWRYGAPKTGFKEANEVVFSPTGASTYSGKANNEESPNKTAHEAPAEPGESAHIFDFDTVRRHKKASARDLPFLFEGPSQGLGIDISAAPKVDESHPAAPDTDDEIEFGEPGPAVETPQAQALTPLDSFFEGHPEHQDEPSVSVDAPSTARPPIEDHSPDRRSETALPDSASTTPTLQPEEYEDIDSSKAETESPILTATESQNNDQRDTNLKDECTSKQGQVGTTKDPRQDDASQQIQSAKLPKGLPSFAFGTIESTSQNDHAKEVEFQKETQQKDENARPSDLPSVSKEDAPLSYAGVAKAASSLDSQKLRLGRPQPVVPKSLMSQRAQSSMAHPEVKSVSGVMAASVHPTREAKAKAQSQQSRPRPQPINTDTSKEAGSDMRRDTTSADWRVGPEGPWSQVAKADEELSSACANDVAKA